MYMWEVRERKRRRDCLHFVPGRTSIELHIIWFLQEGLVFLWVECCFSILSRSPAKGGNGLECREKRRFSPLCSWGRTDSCSWVFAFSAWLPSHCLCSFAWDHAIGLGSSKFWKQEGGKLEGGEGRLLSSDRLEGRIKSRTKYWF